MDPHCLMCCYSSIGSYKTSSLSGSVTPEFKSILGLVNIAEACRLCRETASWYMGSEFKSVFGLITIAEACRLCREIASWYTGPVMLWKKFRSYPFLDCYSIEKGNGEYSINSTGPILY